MQQNNIITKTIFVKKKYKLSISFQNTKRNINKANINKQPLICSHYLFFENQKLTTTTLHVNSTTTLQRRLQRPHFMLIQGK